MAATRVSVGSDSSDSEVHDEFNNNSMEATGLSVDSNSSDSDHVRDEFEHANAGSGITDVIAKILDNAVPKDKGTILAKGQTDNTIKRKKKLKEKEDEPAKKKKKKRSAEGTGEWTDDSDSDKEDAVGLTPLQMLQRKEKDNMARVRPNVLTKERERMLQKIATRGVVQLFNAVRQQQSSLREKMDDAGSSVHRRDKVAKSLTKKQFLDLLDSKETKAADGEAQSVKTRGGGAGEQDAGGERWSVLRENFTAPRMKDWDKDSDDNEGDL